MLLFAAPVHAQSGSYTSPGPTGGQTTFGPTTNPYSGGQGSYGGGAGNYSNGSTTGVSCSGEIDQTYTWQGTDPAPQSVIVTQTSTAKAVSSYSSSAQAAPTCADGLQDSPTVTSSHSMYGYAANASSSGTHYTTQGGASFTVSCSPSASVSINSGQCNASVTYSNSISPVTIQLTGTTKDSSGGEDILVGQGCSASLVGIPNNYTYTTEDCIVSDYQWRVGGTTFQTWSATTPAIGTAPANPNASYYVDGPGPLTNPTAHWYWNEAATTETISCTATVTPPAGEGSPFTVTATKQVHVMVPGWNCTGTGGTMQVNTSAPGDSNYELWAGPIAGSGETGGMDWNATVTSAKAALFANGDIKIVQLTTPNATYTEGTTTHAWSLNGQAGLDTSCPYPWTSGAPNYFGGDTPGTPLMSTDTAATEQSQFVDYLMYVAPGADVQWVPLATFSWGTNGSATQPNPGGWAAFGSGSAGSVTPSGAPVKFSQSNSFPSWTQNSGNPPASSGHWQ